MGFKDCLHLDAPNLIVDVIEDWSSKLSTRSSHLAARFTWVLYSKLKEPFTNPRPFIQLKPSSKAILVFVVMFGLTWYSFCMNFTKKLKSSMSWDFAKNIENQKWSTLFLRFTLDSITKFKAWKPNIIAVAHTSNVTMVTCRAHEQLKL